MNTKRIFFWLIFLVVLGLIVLGLAKAMKKSDTTGSDLGLGAPAPLTDADHLRGSKSSPVTLIEYGDFQCPACEAYYPIVTKAVAETGSTTLYVFRNFPLQQHPNAIPAAIAAEAAGKEGKYWEMFDLLFANHTDWTEKADPTNVFVSYAKQIGLNSDTFQGDLKDPAVKAHVQKDYDEGISLGINGTPTFFVNGKAIRNPQSYDEFKAVLEAAASSSPK